MFKKKNPPIFEYFEKHAQEILAASHLLKQLMHCEKKDSLEIAKKIKDREHIADTVTHDVVKEMNSGNFILPLDREDILALTKSLDEVIDYMDNCAEAFAEVYELEFASEQAKHLASIIVKSAELIVSLCQLLRQPSKYADQILQHCIEIHHLENEGDGVKKDALKRLFQQLKQGTLDTPSYVAWNDIYHLLEGVTDRAEDCAHIAEQIVLKYG
jgi:predicted phosphate transport protein (TIGR00153 family)